MAMLITHKVMITNESCGNVGVTRVSNDTRGNETALPSKKRSTGNSDRAVIRNGYSSGNNLKQPKSSHKPFAVLESHNLTISSTNIAIKLEIALSTTVYDTSLLAQQLTQSAVCGPKLRGDC